MTEPSFKDTPRDGGVPIHLNFKIDEGLFKEQIRDKTRIHYKEDSMERCDCQIQWIFDILDEGKKKLAATAKKCGSTRNCSLQKLGQGIFR